MAVFCSSYQVLSSQTMKSDCLILKWKCIVLHKRFFEKSSRLKFFWEKVSLKIPRSSSAMECDFPKLHVDKQQSYKTAPPHKCLLEFFQNCKTITSGRLRGAARSVVDMSPIVTIYTRSKVFLIEVFLFRIFPHLDWIGRDTECIFIFSPNATKYGPEKLKIWTLFTQCWCNTAEVS